MFRLHTSLYSFAFLQAVALSIAACSSGSGGGPPSPNPQLVPDSVSGPANSLFIIDVLANDSANDAADSVLLADFQTQTTRGGTVSRLNNNTPDDLSDDSLSYQPFTNFSGEDSFTYTARNSSGGSATTTVTITVVAPTVAQACNEDIETKRNFGLPYCIETAFNSEADGAPIEIALQLFVPPRNEMKRIAEEAGETIAPGEKGFSPLIVHSHGFGSNKIEDFDPPGATAPFTFLVDNQVSRDAWLSGYWVISFTQRGFGGQDGAERPSGGQIGLMAPDLEGQDFVRLVDWAVCHLREDYDPVTATDVQNLDPEFENCGENFGRSLLMDDNRRRATGLASDIAVGTIGYSYGGGFQMNAQSVDARIDAMVPLATWQDLRYSLHPNETAKLTWFQLLTAFAIEGGNSEPTPELITDGNQDGTTANADQNDQPYNKPHQVRTSIINEVGRNGVVAYCDNNPSVYGSRFSDADGEPAPFANILDRTVLPRAARADVLFIQGYSDTLFNFNEAYDNARCFKQNNPNLDVRLIGQHSGHPIPPMLNGPVHYAGSAAESALYIDEVIHCGEGTAARRVNTREIVFSWFEEKLRSAADFDALFPWAACLAVQNTDPSVVLSTEDPFYNNGTTNTSATAFQFMREGAVFNSIDDVPVGGTPFALPETTLTTGPGEGATIRTQFAPAYTAEQSHVVAGIPTATLNVARANPSAEEIFYAGLAVLRCHSNPNTTGPCETGIAPELIFREATSIRVFPSAAESTLAGGPPPATGNFPTPDPRNALDPGFFYPQTIGANPGGITTQGRLPGVSVRLHPGDQLGLLLLSGHEAYAGVSSDATGQVTVSGTLFLNQQPATTPPGNSPSYIVPAP